MKDTDVTEKFHEGLDPEKGNGVVNKTFTDDNGKTLQCSDEEEDPWKVSKVVVDEVPMSELDGFGKFKRVSLMIIRIILVLTSLYFFICSLDFLSSSFKLVGGKKAGEVFQNSEILSNPVAGLMMGVLVTVLVQSSSTSTSIVISMVGADILSIKAAIPIIMGANIGTSVTNTIVAMGQITDKNEFRRAFAGATVHDMFNWMSVIILLPLEMATGYLYQLSGAVVRSLPLETNKNAKKDLLKVITKPFTTLIIQVDSKAINKIALNIDGSSTDHIKLMKTCCDKVTPVKCCGNVVKDNTWYSESTQQTYNATVRNGFCTQLGSCVKSGDPYRSNCLNSWVNATDDNTTTETFSCSDWTKNQDLTCYKECNYLFKGLIYEISEEAIGGILLVLSIIILCLCLVSMVKLLNQLLKGQMAVLIKKFVNADFPGVCSYFTGYLAILLGAGMTILVQSSSIFTSSITPLVGMGVIELDRMYPLTLGANIGTTTTGILSALTQDSSHISASLQVAFCHLFFNISGILIFYPFPFFRPPIPLAKFLGNETAKYRWFAIAYIFMMFFVLPAAVFALSIPGWYVLAAVLIPTLVVFAIVLIIKLIQRKRPSLLPNFLKSWKFLPEPLRSLRPYDAFCQKILCGCCSKNKEVKQIAVQNGHNGNAHDSTKINQTTHM